MSSLTKMTVNLVPRAVDAIDRASAVNQDSKTDTVNRAVQLWAFMSELSGQGWQLFVEDPGTGKRERLHLF